MLEQHYPRGITFVVNGQELAKVEARPPTEHATPIAIRVGRRRKPSAFGYLVREELPIPEELRGIAVSTYGKVIKRGWDWLGVNPTTPELVHGLVEVPALAACLTLNKVDFFRTGPRGATYLAYRKALQEAVTISVRRRRMASRQRRPTSARLTSQRRLPPRSTSLRCAGPGVPFGSACPSSSSLGPVSLNWAVSSRALSTSTMRIQPIDAH